MMKCVCVCVSWLKLKVELLIWTISDPEAGQVRVNIVLFTHTGWGSYSVIFPLLDEDREDDHIWRSKG